MFDYLDVNPPKSLLEIGCGFGLSTWIMNDSTKKKAVGLDKNKQAIYDLRADKRENKVGKGPILEKFDIKKLPDYLQKNIEVYKEWVD